MFLTLYFHLFLHLQLQLILLSCQPWLLEKSISFLPSTSFADTSNNKSSGQKANNSTAGGVNTSEEEQCLILQHVTFLYNTVTIDSRKVTGLKKCYPVYNTNNNNNTGNELSSSNQNEEAAKKAVDELLQSLIPSGIMHIHFIVLAML